LWLVAFFLFFSNKPRKKRLCLTIHSSELLYITVGRTPHPKEGDGEKANLAKDKEDEVEEYVVEEKAVGGYDGGKKKGKGEVQDLSSSARKATQVIPWKAILTNRAYLSTVAAFFACTQLPSLLLQPFPPLQSLLFLPS